MLAGGEWTVNHKQDRTIDLDPGQVISCKLDREVRLINLKIKQILKLKILVLDIQISEYIIRILSQC